MAGASVAVARFEEALGDLALRYEVEVEKLKREARRPPSAMTEEEAAEAAESYLLGLEEEVSALESRVDGLHSRATTSPFFSFPQIVAEVSEEYHRNQARIEQWLATHSSLGDSQTSQATIGPSSSPSPRTLSPSAVSPSSLALSPLHRSSSSFYSTAKDIRTAQDQEEARPSLPSPSPPQSSLPPSPIPPSALGFKSAAKGGDGAHDRRDNATIAPVDAEQFAELVPAYLSSQIGVEELQALVESVNEALTSDLLMDVVTQSELQEVLGGYGKVKALILILLKLHRVESYRESNELAFRIKAPSEK